MKRLLLFFLLLFPFTITAFAQTTTKVKTVCIDPGHGGKDPGALGKIAKEKDIALKIALISDQLATIRKRIPDAFVIAVRNGKEKVDVSEAKKELGQ